MSNLMEDKIMDEDYINIFTKEQLQQMDKGFLIERNLLLDDQLKIRIEREAKFNEVINLTLEMLKLDHYSLAALLGQYQFELMDDPELLQRLVNNSERFEEIRKYIVENHCVKDNGFLSDTCYFASEWLDGGHANE